MSRIDAPHGLPKIGGSSLVASSRSTRNEPGSIGRAGGGRRIGPHGNGHRPECQQPRIPVRGRCQARPGADPAQPAEKETWKAPFGGTFTATFAAATDYSYRGISQTQRQVAFQPAFTYETPTVSENVALSAYVGAWGSNVYFGNTNPTVAEIDLIAGLG